MISTSRVRDEAALPRLPDLLATNGQALMLGMGEATP